MQIKDKPCQRKATGQPRRISDELSNDLVKSAGMPVDDVEAIIHWSVIVHKDELKKRGVSFRFDTRKHGY